MNQGRRWQFRNNIVHSKLEYSFYMKKPKKKVNYLYSLQQLCISKQYWMTLRVSCRDSKMLFFANMHNACPIMTSICQNWFQHLLLPSKAKRGFTLWAGITLTYKIMTQPIGEQSSKVDLWINFILTERCETPLSALNILVNMKNFFFSMKNIT